MTPDTIISFLASAFAAGIATGVLATLARGRS